MCAPTGLFKALAANGNYTGALVRASAISGYAPCRCTADAIEQAMSPSAAVRRLEGCNRLQASIDPLFLRWVLFLVA
jgi:hypothetical protein